MQIQRLVLLGSVTLMFVGCATQPPAPVYGNGSGVRSQTTMKLKKPNVPAPVVAPQPPAQPVPVPEIVETKPLGDMDALSPKLEELQPEFKASELPNEVQPAAIGETDQGASNSAQQLVPESLVDVPKPEPVEEAPPAFQPLESFAPLSPAVGALASAANSNTRSGNIEGATVAIERAIRIEPRNPTLYYKLALLRLKQSKPRLAEDLAKKAALLASNDATMKKHSWLLIARAREVQGDINGGKEARAKADSF